MVKNLHTIINKFLSKFLDPIEKMVTLPTTEIIPNRIDKFLSNETLFTAIVISQGLFGGFGISYIPDFIKKLTKKPLARFVFIWAIAFTTSGDADKSLIISMGYVLFLHFMKSPREKKLYPNVL
jgi:hypothetical protein